MSKQFIKWLLILLGCSILLLLAMHRQTSAVVYKEKLVKEETAGTHLLWESLSHQFVSAVQY